jgi:hypothetical protein
LYMWRDDYDGDSLGYMAGVLKNKKFMSDNAAWVV